MVQAGGLHIIGTERHDSRRIDNQLRGRAGRQGDPGSSRFYLSLDDDLMKRFASERVAGLMERLGLDDETAIESGLVSKTIESAQSRVEGYNFDIRKRVVEFDDVINKQRETTYAERDKVLRNEDLAETVRAFLDEEMDVLGDTYVGSDASQEWNLDGLSNALHAMGLDGEGTTADELWELGSREEIVEHLRDLADEKLEARTEEVGAADWSMVERLVLLRTIDSLWVEHLTELDDMRRGIGLRGYAQQDPLNEYRREAFRMYEEFRDLIRHQVASSIFRVTVQKQPAPAVGGDPAGAAAMAAGVAALTGARAGAAAGTGGTGRFGGCRRGGRDLRSLRRPQRPGAARRQSCHERFGGRRRGGNAGPGPAGLHADRRAHRPQRPVLVWVGREVQEVPRPLTADRARKIIQFPDRWTASPSWRWEIGPVYWVNPRCETATTSVASLPSHRCAFRPRREGAVKQAEEASFVDLIACERDCRNCSYAAALDCDGNCGVCPHNSYCPCVNPVVARSKTALRMIELRPILLQDLRARN